MGAEYAIELGKKSADALGTNVASGIGNAVGNYFQRGMDKIFGIDRNQEQLNQQQKLTDMQVRANKDLANYGQGLQKEMFEFTYNKQTPEAMKKLYEEAGMNPALMMGGANNVGGTTTGNASTGSASAGQSANEAEKMQAETARQGMAIQLATQQANIELMKSQAEKNRAEAEAQGYQNVENKIKADAIRILEESTNDISWTIQGEWEARKATAELNKIKSQVESLIESNKFENFDKIKETITQAWIDEFKMKSKQLDLTDNQINTMIKQLELKRVEIYGDEGKTIDEQSLKTWKENTEKVIKAMLWSAGISAAGNLVSDIIGIATKGGVVKTVTESFTKRTKTGSYTNTNTTTTK